MKIGKIIIQGEELSDLKHNNVSISKIMVGDKQVYPSTPILPTIQEAWIDAGLAYWVDPVAKNHIRFYTTVENVPDVSDGEQLTSCKQMFEYCTLLKRLPYFNAENVTNIDNFIYIGSPVSTNNYSLEYIPQYNFSKVTTAVQAFTSIKNNIDFPDMNFISLETASYMFQRSTGFVNIYSWNFPKLVDGSGMFNVSTNNNRVYHGMYIPKIKNMNTMFYNAAIGTLRITGNPKPIGMYNCFNYSIPTILTEGDSYIDMEDCTNATNMLINSVNNLTKINLKNIRLPINLSNCTNLDSDSLKYLATNSKETYIPDDVTLTITQALANKVSYDDLRPMIKNNWIISHLPATPTVQEAWIDSGLFDSGYKYIGESDGTVTIPYVGNGNIIYSTMYDAIRSKNLNIVQYLNLPNCVSLHNTFRGSTINEIDGVLINGSGNMYESFGYYSTIPIIGRITSPNITNFHQTFINNTVIHTIKTIDMNSATSATNMFRGCTALETCYIKNLGISLSLSYCNKLKKDCVIYMFNSMKDVTENPQTITLHIDVLNKLSYDEFKIALDKGWIIDNMPVYGTIQEMWIDTELAVWTDANQNRVLFVTSITEIPLVTDGDRLISAYNMFNGCTLLNLIRPFNTSNIVSWSYAFKDCKALSAEQIENMNIDFKDLFWTFQGCSFNRLPNIKTTNSTRNQGMFYECFNVVNGDINIDLSSVEGNTNNWMFYNCQKMTICPNIINISNNANLTQLTDTFRYCIAIKTAPSIELPNNINSLVRFYRECKALKTIEELDLQYITDLTQFVYGCLALENAWLKNIKASIDLSSTEVITIESILFIFENAQVVTNNQEFIIHETIMTNLTDNQKSIITNKGWTLRTAII